MALNPSADASQVLGVFVLARHGDRQGQYLVPTAYTATGTQLTPLGAAQGYNLGALMQAKYLKRSSPTYLTDVNPDLYINGQSLVRADMGTEEAIIVDTAHAITQGLWPPTKAANSTLADGSYVIAPLNGYQYVPVETVDPNDKLYMEGYTSCNAFLNTASETIGLPDWLTMAQENEDFLQGLHEYVGGRPTTFANVYSAWDYLNVNYIHNATMHDIVPAQVLAHARYLANWHEYYSYSNTDPTHILNIGGQTLVPEMLNLLGRLSNKSDALKFAVYVGSYKPFLSLFAMTGVTSTHPELAGIVNYASAIAMEVRKPTNSSNLFVRFNFKNGTDDADFKPYPMFGHLDGDYDLPLHDFNLALEAYGVPDTLSWCNICNNSIDRGCDYAVQAQYASELMADLIALQNSQSHSSISPVVAGLIGAIVALVVAAALVGLLWFFGFIGGRRGNPVPFGGHHRRSSSIPQIVVRMTKGKRESGDSESTRGVVKDPGNFEMMPESDLPDNISTLSHTPRHEEPMKF